MAWLKYFVLRMVVYLHRGGSKLLRVAYAEVYRKKLALHPSVSIGNVSMDYKNIEIGMGTYMRSGEIYSGDALVKIGEFCAIGKNVSIKARTHSLAKPTRRSLEDKHEKKFSNITIGDRVWIGDNVFIKEGVKIGDDVIIGANSVVTSDVPCRAIAAGIPAKVIRYNIRNDA